MSSKGHVAPTTEKRNSCIHLVEIQVRHNLGVPITRIVTVLKRIIYIYIHIYIHTYVCVCVCVVKM